MTASRSTFRNKAGAVCWQKQLRDRFAAEGTPPVPHLDLGRAIVRPISRRLAEQVILKYEWLGTMSTTSLHFGIFFGPYCAGVTCVSIGAAMAGVTHHIQFGVGRKELLTLARGACVHWAPPGTNSKLVAWTIRLLARAKAGKLIWATSDPDAGEIGTIYQACGWTYIGRSGAKTKNEIVSPKGRNYNVRNVTSWARKNGVTFSKMFARLMAAGWTQQHSSAKGRYVAILDKTDKRLADTISRMSQPYPKRAGSSAVERSESIGEVEGSNPIPALSSSSPCRTLPIGPAASPSVPPSPETGSGSATLTPPRKSLGTTEGSPRRRGATATAGNRSAPESSPKSPSARSARKSGSRSRPR